MNVLAFAASSSKNSINKQLINYATGLLDDSNVEILDINDYEMPIYSSDREQENGIPEEAHKFFDKIASADALLISYAEHNGSYTAAYKNLYDWASRIDMKVYQGKPMVIMAASPGPGGARNVLESAKTSAPFFGGEVKADLSVASFYDNFDVEAGKPKSDDLHQSLVDAVSYLN